MNKLFIFLFLIVISGCTVIPGKCSMWDDTITTAPSVNNNYYGTSWFDPKQGYHKCGESLELDLNSIKIIESACSTPDSKQFIFAYKCNTLNQEKTKLTMPLSAPNNKLNYSIKDAKEKCKGLGYKEKTEKFGTCVLELTK
jgi:hypothetical protein